MKGKIGGCILVMLASLQTGCVQWFPTGLAQPTPACPPIRMIPESELPPSAFQAVAADGEVDAIPRYEAAIHAKLMAGAFDELEQIAADLRTSKARFPGGAWKLERFYEGASYPSGDMKTESELNWGTQLDQLHRWVAAKPNSLAAHLALGKALLGYGWHARGEGYANTITEEGGRLFGERVDQAEKALADVSEMRASDPAWYSAMLEIGVSQGWRQQDFDRVFEEGVAVEPLYYYLYFEKARYLMPRWYGQAGDDERFMDESFRRLGGKEGSAMYYLIGECLFPYYPYRTIVTDSKICWETMKEGYFSLESLYGISVTRMNWMAKISGVAGEKPMCKWLFARLGDRWDPNVWRQGKTDFDSYRSWANS